MMDLNSRSLACERPGPVTTAWLAAIGYRPKMFQSLLHFQRLLNFAKRPARPASLADLAAVAGYADPAHMIREVQRFAPAVLIPSATCTLRMSDLLKTDHSVSYQLGSHGGGFVTRRGLVTWMGASLALPTPFHQRETPCRTAQT